MSYSSSFSATAAAEANKSKHRSELAEIILLQRSDYDAKPSIEFSDGVRRHGNEAPAAAAVEDIIFRSSVSSSVRRLLRGAG